MVAKPSIAAKGHVMTRRRTPLEALAQVTRFRREPVREATPVADVCIIVEGAYPYIVGGVSGWLQDLMTHLPEVSFHIVAIKAGQAPLEWKLAPPSNVIAISEIALTPERTAPSSINPRTVGRILSNAARFIEAGEPSDFAQLLQSLEKIPSGTSAGDLLSHSATFERIRDDYLKTYPQSSFHHYFWANQALLGGLLAICLAPLPRAKCYHTISTGFAGLFGARASLVHQRPLCLTEHGIYLLERQIEILMANWIGDQVEGGLALSDGYADLRDFWQHAFEHYSSVCYARSEKIIALYAANNAVQQRLGASPERLVSIPNGIDASGFADLLDQRNRDRPLVALLGRVVPIKDVKTFIRAADIVHAHNPQIDFVVLGPIDEDKDYAKECIELAQSLSCRDVMSFAGRVNIKEWLPKIDLLVLTSLSEAQPLVILEGGACGIPVVAPDVGSCREMIEGKEPGDAHGGVVTPLVNPNATAQAIEKILLTPGLRDELGQALKNRVIQSYDHPSIINRYRNVYSELTRLQPDSATQISSN